MADLLVISDQAYSTEDLFDASSNGVRRLFEIRPPQRRFRWERTQVKQLWDDLAKAHSLSLEEYFLGTILVAPLEGGRVAVVDGQQRLATLSILLAVLRDRCNAIATGPMRHRTNKIHELIAPLDNNGEPTGDLIIRLQSPENSTYDNLVREIDSTKAVHSNYNMTPSQKSLVNATKCLINEVTATLNVPDSTGKLAGIVDYILNQVKLLVLRVKNEREGRIIFDTTNTRGLKLSPADALKGKLATISRDNPQLIDNLLISWDAVGNKIEARDSTPRAMHDYLYAIWSTRGDQEFIAKGKIDAIADERPITELKSFIDDLKDYCDSYLAVVATNDPTPKGQDLKDLTLLNQQCRPFLTMVHRFANAKFWEAVNLVLTLQVRNISIGSENPNRYSKLWARWARLVKDGHFDSAKMEIVSRLLPDEEFKVRFVKFSKSGSPLTRHLLRRMDPAMSPDLTTFTFKADVEHIFPQSVVKNLNRGSILDSTDKYWIHCFRPELGDDLESLDEQQKKELSNELGVWLERLGNKCLLNGKINKSIKDGEFEGKREEYMKQSSTLTMKVAEDETWGPYQIEKRQEFLAERALQVWKVE